MLSILLIQLPPDKRGLYIGPYGLQYKLMIIKKDTRAHSGIAQPLTRVETNKNECVFRIG